MIYFRQHFKTNHLNSINGCMHPYPSYPHRPFSKHERPRLSFFEVHWCEADACQHVLKHGPVCPQNLLGIVPKYWVGFEPIWTEMPPVEALKLYGKGSEVLVSADTCSYPPSTTGRQVADTTPKSETYTSQLSRLCGWESKNHNCTSTQTSGS